MRSRVHSDTGNSQSPLLITVGLLSVQPSAKRTGLSKWVLRHRDHRNGTNQSPQATVEVAEL